MSHPLPFSSTNHSSISSDLASSLPIVDSKPPETPKETHIAPSGDLAPMFGQLLVLMREQNKMIADQGKTLKDQSTMLETLKTDALKNDQPFEKRSLRDRLTWGMLRKEASSKTKEKVDEWKELMQLSLVFMAIFLTVVTAFIAPVIQLFTSMSPTPTTDSSSKMPTPLLPPLSTQLVALFFYLALIIGILNAVLCVLGMQWASRLLAIPVGKDDLERTLAHEKRRALAEGKLLPLMGVLFWTLLLSIGLFIIGLLIQLWALSFSSTKPSFVLVVGAAISTGLSILILGVILATTYHAAITENSPFESPLSAAMRPALQWFQFRNREKQADPKKSAALEDQVQSEVELTVDDLVKAKENDADSMKAFKTYVRLVLNTSDSEVLERAVSSFEFGEWCGIGDGLLKVFHAVRERFLATDTSFRVKETVNQQLVYCRQWSGWRNGLHGWREDLNANTITRWCSDQCKILAGQSHNLHQQFFPSWVFFQSLEPNNSDLRGDAGHDSYEGTVARVLSSFDRKEELGDREDILSSAIIECRSLLYDGRLSEVTNILSYGSRSSILRSLLQNPSLTWGLMDDLVTSITQGNEVVVLEEMAPFFSDLPDMEPVHGNLLVMEFLGALIPSLPPTFVVPQSFNLAPVCALFLRHSQVLGGARSRHIGTLLYYLDHGGFELLPSLDAVHEFFEVCLTQSSLRVEQNNITFNRAQTYLTEYHEAFTALPEPTQQDYDDLVNAILAYKDDRTSGDMQALFADTVKECDSLSREGNEAAVKNILSRVDDLPLLEILIQTQRLRSPGLRDQRFRNRSLQQPKSLRTRFAFHIFPRSLVSQSKAMNAHIFKM
ncbi:hypothetical protein SISSUDRAFT_566920 [Sistotremastrum suecicum HHB10207 ss-3]|uniref:DUF6535 domain-containing protein n=1 Tax=Sistotremastrum suecicum HHB10207 ss-3 TaxID=1314776 RepID=A0A165XJ16_9AGAM|nr:hypothetical protein SISSUDRAFT_566920 [Sistotremastrum suecicum HHB10207 ss-3]